MIRFLVLLVDIHLHFGRYRFPSLIRLLLLFHLRHYGDLLLHYRSLEPFLSGHPISRLISSSILHHQPKLHLLDWILSLVVKFVLKVEPTWHVACDFVIGGSGDKGFGVLGIGDFCEGRKGKKAGMRAWAWFREITEGSKKIKQTGSG